MSTTGRPNAAPNGPGIIWSFGTGTGGIWSLKRVAIEDKIRTQDINQIRTLVEEMWNHTHEYEDVASETTTYNTTNSSEEKKSTTTC